MKMAAGVFKAKCLKLMDTINRTHEEIIITKHGKPVAKMVPIEKKDKATSPFGYLKGSIIITGDIVAPTGEKWEAEQDD